MKETSFIKKNKPKWQEFEQLLNQPNADSDKLASLFIETTHDLSYARTFYNNRSIKVYINNISQRIIYEIYKHNSAGFLKSIKKFWKEELPDIIVHCRKEFIISTLVFLLSVAIGVFCTIYDESFTRSILGDYYVNLTEENIKKGDAMAIYKSQGQANMFFQITLNNIFVAFITFIGGLLLGAGSIAALLGNGIMLGTFQYFFIQRGLFLYSFSTIWLHGTVEISSIVIAGAAGLVLGKGLAFPGTYNRAQSFYIHGIMSLKILAGTIPLFIFAGFIESFITRYADTPVVIKLALILFSAIFMIGYYVYYPYSRKRAGLIKPVQYAKIKPFNFTWDLHKIKTTGDIIYETFVLIRQKFSPILKTLTILGFVMLPVYHFTTSNEAIHDQRFYTVSGNLDFLFDNLNYNNNYFNTSLVLAISILVTQLQLMVLGLSPEQKQIPFKKKIVFFLQNFLFIAAFSFLNPASGSFFKTMLGVMLTCIAAMISTSFLLFHESFFQKAGKGFSLFFSSILNFFVIYAILFICGFALFIGLEAGVNFLWYHFLTTAFDSNLLISILRFVDYLINAFAVYFIYLFPIIGSILLTYSVKEIKTADRLIKRINEIKIK